MEVQAQYISNQGLHRVDNPALGYPATREELFSYDVIICSDISRFAFLRSNSLDRRAGRSARRRLRHGRRQHQLRRGKWDRTIWDQLIPVKMSGNRPNSLGQGYVNGQFRVVVPITAERHPIWRLAEDPVQNNLILNAMPPFYGTNLIDRVKPGATVLVCPIGGCRWRASCRSSLASRSARGEPSL